MKHSVGLVGWRGMVGSVLMDRMQAEGDFALIEPLFFSHLQRRRRSAGDGEERDARCKDAYDIDALKRCDIIITAQGGDYTNEVFPKLRAAGWKGHWIDAASTLRMKDDAVIILDPVNLHVIKNALAKGGRNWIGGNCTVSCMLMGVGALFKAGLVEWMSTHDLPGGLGRRRAAHARAADAVRHAERRGARRCWTTRRRRSSRSTARSLATPARAGATTRRPTSACRWAARLIPWIDKDLGNGISREEWKGGAETNKILGQGAGFGTRRFRSMASACASARCAATARR